MVRRKGNRNCPGASRSLGLAGQLVVLGLLNTVAFATSVVTTSAIDGGGLRATSANYAMDNSVGGIGGISSGSADTGKYGYIGQLAEVVSLSVTGTPNTVNETATSQLSGIALLDDLTEVALNGGDIGWMTPVYPIASIDGLGLATASAVYATTNGVVGGSYVGTTGLGSLVVIDSSPDNYGSYAGDEIPDSWQIQYFGLNNPNATPNGDADGTGQNNLFKFVAGLDPTNPASVFVVKIAGVNGQPPQKNLIYNPIAGGRTYTPQFVTSLVGAVWSTLSTTSNPTTNGNQVAVTDTGASQPVKFYRIHISLP